MPLIAAGIAAVASIVAAKKGSDATKSAAQTQYDATKYAADVQQYEAEKSLLFQEKVYDKQQTDQAPYIAAGKTALSQLQTGTAEGGDLIAPWTETFKAPTAQEAMASPGVQEGLNLGTEAINASAASKGTALGGGTLRDLQTYSQNYGATQYQQVYNNAQTAYQEAYQTFVNNQNNTYNKLYSLAGLGQASASNAAASGNNAAALNSTTNTNLANSLSSLSTSGANALASGIVGSANAWSSGLAGIANNSSSLVGQMQNSGYSWSDLFSGNAWKNYFSGTGNQDWGTGTTSGGSESMWAFNG